ncbi:hypothetical protein AB1Y20_004161 [Prymnesium parvum]|uniref:Uncharacterized protein n=1 Tax=Prymnesium parvum TaxID=97485 RepID=A0AB34J6U8_PRYPA
MWLTPHLAPPAGPLAAAGGGAPLPLVGMAIAWQRDAGLTLNATPLQTSAPQRPADRQISGPAAAEGRISPAALAEGGGDAARADARSSPRAFSAEGPATAFAPLRPSRGSTPPLDRQSARRIALQAPLMLQLLMPVLFLGAVYGVCLVVGIIGSRLWTTIPQLPSFSCCARRRAVAGGKASHEGSAKEKAVPPSARSPDPMYPRRGFVYNSSWGELHGVRGGERDEEEGALGTLTPSCSRFSLAGEGCTAV